jgi:hypothetical protein
LIEVSDPAWMPRSFLCNIESLSVSPKNLEKTIGIHTYINIEKKKLETA